jgi:hypothetical protein
MGGRMRRSSGGGRYWPIRARTIRSPPTRSSTRSIGRIGRQAATTTRSGRSVRRSRPASGRCPTRRRISPSACWLQGRSRKPTRLFATLRERDPEDVWLYNAAAYSYADLDVATSLRWALEGIEVALATGDPDQVVMQLLESAEDAWEELGEPADQQLVRTVERFCDEWTRVPSRRPWGDLPTFEDRPCAHCGYQPDTSRTEQDERARRNRRRLLETEAPEALARLDALGGPEPKAKLPGSVELAIGWFPADQWPEACQRWPDLLDDLPADHLAYNRETEARIKRIARHTPGSRLHVAAMTVDGLQAHAAESGYDPGSGEARSSYAAALLQAGNGVVWPPGRNESCWCGSERKYKKCCGPVPAAADGAS